MVLDPAYVVYGGLAAGLLAIYFLIGRKRENRSRTIKAAAIEAGMTEPASLHPVIDPARCLGCATCTRACPEGDVLGIINGKAELIEPTHCIGHGACASACPTSAITLVFGSASRGVDLPTVGPDFQTNVPGIFIAGELGGMGLIRNAVEQGRQAVESIRKQRRPQSGQSLDLLIVGAGPAGFAAALAAKAAGLTYVVVEQDDLGGCVFKYPRGKVVMTAPVKLPLVGAVNFRETTKEALLEFWRGVELQQQLNVRYRERVERVRQLPSGFEVETGKGRHVAASVLLAIGRRGTPRRLGVTGEDLAKVVYAFVDPEQYRGKHVLVVGGGDSALEAAGRIAEEPGTTVTLSYRGSAFSRAKPANRERVERLRRDGQLSVMMPSQLKAITEAGVDVDSEGRSINLPNDAVIICVGGVLPTEFLKAAGIAMETKYGTV